jgi:aspartate racemase
MNTCKATHIGIVACSPPGAALCFQAVCELLSQRGDTRSEVSVHAHAFGAYMTHVNKPDWAGVADLMVDSAARLTNQGADLLIAPCNMIHAAFDRVVARTSAPWLHIASEVARHAGRIGVRRMALLGTRITMEGSIYAPALAAASIECVVPGEADRIEMDRFIFDELAHGVVSDRALSFFGRVAGGLIRSGCDAVGLCCTELPLVISAASMPVPVLDSARVLAQAAVERTA